MILALVASPEGVGAVCNIGSDRPVSILELARRVLAAVEAGDGERGTGGGKASSQIQFQSYLEAYGADFEDCRRRVPDLSKLKRLTGLEARYSLDDILRELVAWKAGKSRERGVGSRE
jgi:UDP-glucose 4-epimerase